MTAAKLRTLEPAAPVVDSIPVGAEAASEPNSWDDVLSNVAGADAPVHVYAEPEKGQGGAEFCFAVHRDECDWTDLLERIRAECGGGLYSFRVKVNGRWYGGRRLRIRGRARDAVAPPAGTLAPARDPVLEMQLRMMETNQKFLTDMALKLAGQGGGGASITDVIQAAKLLTDGGAKRDPFEDLLKLEKVRAMLAGMGGGGGGDDEGGTVGATTTDLILQSLRTFGEPLAKFIGERAAPPAPGAPGPSPAPTTLTGPTTAIPAPAPAPAAAPPPKPRPPDPMRMLLGLMLRGAANESDPAAYAMVALDAIGDDAVAAMVSLPDAVDRLCALDARAVPHREWIAQVIEQARLMLADEDDGAGDLTKAQGDSNGGADESGPMH